MENKRRLQRGAIAIIKEMIAGEKHELRDPHKRQHRGEEKKTQNDSSTRRNGKESAKNMDGPEQDANGAEEQQKEREKRTSTAQKRTPRPERNMNRGRDDEGEYKTSLMNFAKYWLIENFMIDVKAELEIDYYGSWRMQV